MSRVRIRQEIFRWSLGSLFFVSGFTGLLYEVIWAKYLALLLGSSAYAQVGVLAVFMGGLAVGSIVWGRVADRCTRPLLLYGVLEIGVGLCAAVFAYGFDWLSHLYWAVLAALGNVGLAATAAKSCVCIVAMFPPTFCMGGTLPVITRALGREGAGLGRGVAYLYAVNSLGAALGAVVTGFYLVADRSETSALASKQQLGGLYVTAGAHHEALASFDAALARSAASDGGVPPAALLCARAMALEQSAGSTAAGLALHDCLRLDPTNTMALSSLRRLEAVGR